MAQTSQREESKLKRNITFGPLMGIAVGQIIGAGIMTMTGTAIGMTGTGVFLAYIFSALFTTYKSLPTAVLGASVPTTGGEYRYVSRFLGKKWGFIFLAIYMVSRLTLALYALSCASYLVNFITGVPQHVIAIIILVITFAINLMGTKQSAWVTTVMTVLLLVGLGFYLFYGLPKVDYAFTFAPSNMFAGGVGGFISALALLSFATGGASVIGNMGSEIVEPHKNIPKVIVFSTLAVGVLYALVAIVATGVLPLDVVAGQNLSLVAREIMPSPIFFYFTVFAGAGATAKTLNVTLSWTSKPILVACDDGLLPKSLGKVNDKGVPYIILTAFFIIGLVPLLLGIDINIISRAGTAIGLVSQILYCYAFLKFPEKYPKEYENSSFKVSRSGIKAIGIGSMLINIVFSTSLVLGLPTGAIVLFLVVFVGAAIYANSGALNKVEIPNDLAVDYTTGQAKA